MSNGEVKGTNGQPNQLGFGFIYKKTKIDKSTKELDLFYDGQIFNIDRTLDEQESLDRYKDTDKTKVQKMQLKVFGDTYSINMPMADTSLEMTNVTNKFLDYIMQKAEVGFISDKIYQSLLAIVKGYQVMATKDGVVYFDRKLEDKEKLQTPAQIQATEDKYIVTTVMKEWLDGYYRFKEYQLTEANSVPIGHEYNIRVEGKSYGTMFGSYTPALRWAMFAEKHDFNKGNKTLMTWQYDCIRKLGWMNYFCAPRRAGKCKWELGKVVMSNGSLTDAKDIKVGDLIMGSDGSPVKVKDVQYFEKECVRVTLKNGMSDIVTTDHHCPTQKNFRGGKRDLDIDNYKQADQLQGGDYLACIFNIKNDSAEGTFNEGLLLGAFLGDGACQSSTIRINNPGSQEYMLQQNPNTLIQHKKYLQIRSPYRKNFQSKHDLNHLSYTKYIHGNVFGMSNQFKRGVVNGLLMTDGYISANESKSHKDGYQRKPKTCMEYCSVSEKLVDGLQLLLMQLGVHCYKRSKPIKSNFKSKVEVAYYLNITDLDGLDLIFKNTNLTFKKNYGKAKVILEQPRKYTNNSLNTIPVEAFKEHTTKGIGHRTTYNGVRPPEYNFQRWKCKNYGIQQRLQYSWNEVKSIEYVGLKNVVHIEVDGDHIYVSNGILTHNTRRLSFMAVREIIRQGTSKQESGRPIRVLYIGLTDQKNRAARDYILNMSKKYRAAKMFRRKGEEQRLSFMDQEGNELGVVDFISAKSYEAGVGEYADLILIDEAARIKEAVYSAILPIVTNEGSRLICVSTLDWKTKKNWFYKELIKAERIELMREPIEEYILNTREKYSLHTVTSQADVLTRPLYDYKFNTMVDRQAVGLRYTIDDIEYISELQKKISKDKLKEYPSRYLAELYGIFPDEGKIFPYETCLKERQRIDEQVFDYIVMAYDPAIKQDTGAVIVMGYSRLMSKLVLIDEREMPRETYSNHPEIIQQMKGDYIYRITDKNINKIYLVVDITGNYGLVSLFDVKNVSIDCKIHYTGGEKPHCESDGIWKVPKEHLVDTMKDVMDGNAMWISDDLSRFIDEMNYFQMTQSEGSENMKYEAVEGHDDFVNAAMTGTFFVYSVMSEKYAMMKSKEVEYSQQDMTYKQVMEAVGLKEKEEVKKTRDQKYKNFMAKYGF